jgi:hypothetical protein
MAAEARTRQTTLSSMTETVSTEKYLAFLLTNFVNLCYIQSDYSLTFASKQLSPAA